MRLPPLANFAACGFILMVTEGAALHEPWLRTRYHDHGERFRDRIALGALVSGVDYVQAQRRRRELTAATNAALREVDLLLTAAAPGEAPRIDAVTKWGSFDRPGFSAPFNVTGMPAAVVCGGFGPEGLPLGIQIAGRAFDEALVLRAAHAFEQATPWRGRRPALAG